MVVSLFYQTFSGRWTFMNPYIPVLLVLIFGLTLGAILSALAAFMGPRNPRPEKIDPYECGVPKVTSANEKMSVKFYLTAILFILFDIETIFLYLWAKAFPRLGWFGVSEILVFMVILVAGYIYVVKRGALEWD
jgi:NADH-quinone oxidoreductase subunit A